MEITPAAIVVIPLTVVALRRRRWTIALLIGSAPFVSLTVVSAISHEFSPDEIVLIGLIGKQFYAWLDRRELVIGDVHVYRWLVLFGVICVLSVVYAAIRPARVTVHPYNVGGFGTFEFRTLAFSGTNLTQLALRLFYVTGIVVIAKTIDSVTEIRQSVRWLVLSGLLVGFIGIIYQLSILTNLPVHAVMGWIGFDRFPSHPRFIGPVPRMYSLPGEPGFTADYLLFTLTLATTLFLWNGHNGVLTRREAGVSMGLLLTFLLLSTGTTGYGGLGILVAVLLASAILVERLRSRNTVYLAGVTVATVPLILSFDVFILGGQLQSVFLYQLEKLSFQAGSGTTRLRFMVRTIDLVRTRPLLGVGVGSHHAPSLLFTLLAEVGFLGFTAYVAFHASLFRRCGRFAIVGGAKRIDVLYLALVVAGVTLFLTNLVAKSVSTLMFPWYWFSLALPLALLRYRRRGRDYEA